MQLNPVAGQLGVSPTLGINDRAKSLRAAGQSVYHFGFGQAPFPVPERLQEELARHAYAQDYMPSAGYQPLREAATAYHCTKAGLNPDEWLTLVGPGSKILLFALQMAIEGDVLLPIPSWVSYHPQARLLKQNVIKVPATFKNGYIIEPETLQAAITQARHEGLNPTKIILNSPNNPTGLKIPVFNLRQIAAVCEQNDITILSDEIYALVDFDEEYTSIAQYAPQRTCITTGLSKHLSLGGWRVGITLIPKHLSTLIAAVEAIASELWSAAPSPIQKACVSAYSGHPDIEAHITTCTRAHSTVMGWMAKELNQAGLYTPAPQGAFYLFPDFSGHKSVLKGHQVHKAAALSAWLLNAHNIASLPSTSFGMDDNALYLRLSGTDYDGAAVLDHIKTKGIDTPETFVQHAAPSVYQGIRTLAEIFKEC